MGQSNPKLVSYAAQDGRVDDLVYHLTLSGPDGLRPAAGSEKRRTPLHLASIAGHVECISVLFDAGANLNVKDSDGMTALHHAAANGHLYAAQLLLNLGAKEMTTRFGISPIHLATSFGHTPMMKIMADNGIDLNQQESWGQTPLMIATQQSRIHCMKLLLELSVNTELRDHLHGNTVLHIAAAVKDEETLLVLLDGGCNVHVVNNASLTPLGVAIENKFYRAIPLLLEYGAIPNENDIERCTGGLYEFIQASLSNPPSLSRLARVSLRKAFGPSDLNERLQSLCLPEDLVKFVMSVRDDCCSSNEAKKHALMGRTLIVKSAATTKF